MNGDTVYPFFHHGSVRFRIDRKFFQLIQRLEAVYHPVTKRNDKINKLPPKPSPGSTTHFPNSVYLRSSAGWAAYVMKNWLAFVFGPLLAIEIMPRSLCFSPSRNSSSNLRAQID